jgi:DNA-binding MarR family transcriptional regulator
MAATVTDNPTADKALEQLARDLFEVARRLVGSTPRPRRQVGDLKEAEFLTLSYLEDVGTVTVGELQREMGVLPAQMSRLIRALEGRPRPLILCRLNPHDKRKIDVSLTPEGAAALAATRARRAGRVLELLRRLEETEREEVADLVARLRDALREGR